MALIFIDGCESNGNISPKFDYVDSFATYVFDSTLRPGAIVMKIATSADRHVDKYFEDTSTIVIGLSMRAYDMASYYPIQIRSVGSYQVTLTFDLTGAMQARLGNQFGTIIATAPAGTISNLDWAYYEFKVVIHPTAGSVELRKNGIEVFKETDIDTEYTEGVGVSRLYICGKVYVSDIYLDDSNFHAAPGRGCRIDTLWPTINGTYSQMTPSAGTNAECVDDGRVANSDDDYVTSSTLNEIDTYEFTDIDSLGTTIEAVAHSFAAKQLEVGNVELTPITRINSSDYLGSAKSLITSYSEYQNIMELNPDDSSAWEEADINAAEFGQKRTT